jgi:hypothetical protein
VVAQRLNGPRITSDDDTRADGRGRIVITHGPRNRN